MGLHLIGFIIDAADALKEASDFAQTIRHKNPSVKETQKLIDLVARATQNTTALGRAAIGGDAVPNQTH